MAPWPNLGEVHILFLSYLFHFWHEGNFVTETGLDSSEGIHCEVAVPEQLFSFANNKQSEQMLNPMSSVE